MNTVVSDADALIALAHKEDANHDKAVTISTKLLARGVTIIFPNTAILEAITSLKRALNLPEKSALVNKQYQVRVSITRRLFLNKIQPLMRSLRQQQKN